MLYIDEIQCSYKKLNISVPPFITKGIILPFRSPGQIWGQPFPQKTQLRKYQETGRDSISVY